MAQGPVIKLLEKYKQDAGLTEHEKVHVRQWYIVLGAWFLICTALMLGVSTNLWPLYGLAPSLHQLLYRLVRPYRCWCEVQAYRKQLAVGCYTSNEFAVALLVEKYGLSLSAEEARALLTD